MTSPAAKGGVQQVWDAPGPGGVGVPGGGRLRRWLFGSVLGAGRAGRDGGQKKKRYLRSGPGYLGAKHQMQRNATKRQRTYVRQGRKVCRRRRHCQVQVPDSQVDRVQALSVQRGPANLELTFFVDSRPAKRYALLCVGLVVLFLFSGGAP